MEQTVKLSKITENKIEASGTISITNNGIYDVKDYASADVNVIGSNSFDYLKIIDRTITEIPESALDGLTSIGDYAFYDCDSLESVVIPDGVTSIGYNAFYSCSRLKQIFLPAGINNIDTQAFLYAYIESVYFKGEIKDWCNIKFSTSSSTPTYYKASLYIGSDGDWKEVTDLVIPQEVTEIGRAQFYGFPITSVSFHNSLKTIGDYAFFDSNITEITIPGSVTSIGNEAFKACDSISTITFLGTKSDWLNISLGVDWNVGVPATYVQCSDGQVEL